ncbi:MAG: hypothetical protein QE284_17360 [Rhizobium sp.]|nr:hypothetical protein [Rhizobium sp.]
MESISALLRRVGPSLSTELIAEMAKDGVSLASARQRIARAGTDVVRLAGLRFPHNARFLYLSEQFGDQAYWRAVERVFKNHGKAYWSAMAGLKARGGCFPRKYFAGVCGSPAARVRQLSPERILERLSSIHMLEELIDPDTGQPFVQFKPYVYGRDEIAKVRARLVAENVVLHGMKEWCRRTGFGSFDRVRIRDDETPPVVSSITWDMSAPCYARPLVKASASGLKPGFVVCDVNLRGVLDEDAVTTFVRKHDLASAPVNVAPIMPFLIADGFTTAGFRMAKSKGVLATTTAHLFGGDVAKALRDLISLLSDTGKTASVNPEHVERVLSNLTRIEGAANNLRGALFEIVVGSLVKDVEGGYLRAGEKWTDFGSGRSAEIDVLLDRPDDKGVLIIECKSKIPGSRVNLEEVQRWHGDRVPLLHSIIRTDSRFYNKPLSFELWTNGPIAVDALAWLREQPIRSDLSLAWRDGTEMKTYTDRAANTAIRKALNEHYFRHPLAKIDGATRRAAQQTTSAINA